MRLGSIKSLLIFALLCCVGTAYAEIQYELRGFGSRHAVVILSGEGHDSLTVTPSSDGQNVRITGVNASFESLSPGKSLPIISSIRQVRRGGFTDLIINLSSSGDITATPSAKDLQIFIRSRGDVAITQPTSDEATVGETLVRNKTNTLPLRVVPGANPDGKLQSVAILLPDPVSQHASLPITAGLVWVSYGIELLWRWASGAPLDFNATMAQSEQIVGSGELETRNQELQAQLDAARVEIATLKHQMSAR